MMLNRKHVDQFKDAWVNAPNNALPADFIGITNHGVYYLKNWIELLNGKYHHSVFLKITADGEETFLTEQEHDNLTNKGICQLYNDDVDYNICASIDLIEELFENIYG